MNIFARFILVFVVFAATACGTAKFSEKGATQANADTNLRDDLSLDPVKPLVPACDAKEQATITTQEQTPSPNEDPANQSQNTVTETVIVSTTCVAPAAKQPAQN
ncbi:MAG: hypothetical protein H7318_17265 [Oligoflexus sp.]|nr:hypothetical protein [Oligoflexus sp.]